MTSPETMQRPTFATRLRRLVRRPSGNALRAAVLGVNDGLVSNFCLVMGLQGAGAAQNAILLAGLAGLIAGACSMALGEWLSVTNSREMNTRRLRDMAREFDNAPATARRRLVEVMSGRGIDAAEAERAVSEIMQDRQGALDTLARDVLGINPQERGGNPAQAAVISFVLFGSGALVPVLPFMLGTGLVAGAASVAVCLLALGAVGCATASFNGRSAWFSALRQIVIGGIAAAFTYGAGALLGVSLA